jgi:hypothetical protein
VPWPRIGRKGELSERRAEELRGEQGTVRCWACAWTFTGSMAEGIVAARQHRLAQHGDLPGKTPNPNRRKPAQATASGARPNPAAEYELRDRLIGLLKEAAKPLTAKELAALAGDVSPNAATTTLVWARKDGTPLHRRGAAWAYGAGEDVADPGACAHPRADPEHPCECGRTARCGDRHAGWTRNSVVRKPPQAA